MTKQELVTFICDLFNINKCNDMILRQINKYVTEHGYSYKDIARALCYFTDIQGKTVDLKYGIGIVPFVIDEARRYFEQERKAREAQKRAANQGQAKVIKYKPSENSKTSRKAIDLNQLV
jgi:hypothetical protein